MSNSIFIFKLNNNFKSLQNEDSLDLILDTFYKSYNSEFYQKQLNLMIENINIDEIKANILNYFKNKDIFHYHNNSFYIHNPFKNEDETLEFFDNHFLITKEGQNSLFLDYMCLYFIDYIAIEIENEKIYQLQLVKNNVLV